MSFIFALYIICSLLACKLILPFTHAKTAIAFKLPLSLSLSLSLVFQGFALFAWFFLLLYFRPRAGVEPCPYNYRFILFSVGEQCSPLYFL